MDPISEGVSIAIIGGLVALVGALLSFHAGRAVNKANAFSINANTLMSLSDKVQALSDEVIKLKSELEDLEDKNRVLWAYTYTLLDHMKKNRIKPPAPPSELENDPKLATLIQWIYEQKAE